MSLSWTQRKKRLRSLLGIDGDGIEEGRLIDTILDEDTSFEGQSKLAIDGLRFKESDVRVMGTLAYGQFGTVELITCIPNGRLYVRKRMEKQRALKTSDQCSPQMEREIFVRGLTTKSCWIPAMLCAFQDRMHLSIVMQYAEGGSLWDVLEAYPGEKGLPLLDLKWWIPQCVCAIDWCHSQGFIHRDIKPHNFVLQSNGHLLLIDFGSAAPLLEPQEDGVRLVPSEFCVVPCGTCDYISPEILRAHEEALVQLEMTVEDDNSFGSFDRTVDDKEFPNLSAKHSRETNYGREADWWSLGAMIYEMAFGVAPFFARDIRQTYIRIMEHEKSLRFDNSIINLPLVGLLKGLLCTAETRLGRHDVQEIQMQLFFEGIDWNTLHDQQPPHGLHLPHFTYASPVHDEFNEINQRKDSDESSTKDFTFSALFQSSQVSAQHSGQPTTRETQRTNRNSSISNVLLHKKIASFIGFTWGPTFTAFEDDNIQLKRSYDLHVPNQKFDGDFSTMPIELHQLNEHRPNSDTPYSKRNEITFTTPIRPFRLNPGSALPPGSSKRSTQRRAVSDREAMKQLVECVTMSAKKRVIASGRKPRVLAVSDSPHLRSANYAHASQHTSESTIHASRRIKALRFDEDTLKLNSQSNGIKQPKKNVPDLILDTDALTSSSDAETDIISPSPSPRPGSAMSMSMFDRTSITPTATVTVSQLLTNTDSPSFENTSTSVGSYLLEEISVTLPDAVFGDMEQRHAKLTSDLQGVQKRLDNISVQIQKQRNVES